jgi:hypothetical protein
LALSGLNCLFWNMYRDFGVGQMGDMGAQPWICSGTQDAGAPASIEVDQSVTDKFDPTSRRQAEGEFRASGE